MKLLALLIIVCLAATSNVAQAQRVLGSAPPTEKTPPPAVEPGPQDTRNSTAKQIGDRIKTTNAEVLSLGDELLKPVAIARKNDRLGELKRIDELRKGFKSALVSVNTLNETCITLDRELRHATNAYDAVATAYRDRSEDYTDGKLKEATYAFALHYEKLRDACPEKRKQLDALRKEIPATVVMIRESGAFLDDYALFVSTYANEVVPEAVAQEHTKVLQDYVQKFETFEKALKTYRKENP